MITCGLCDSENIDGAEICDNCGQPLDDLHLRPPTNEVERSLLRDRVSLLDPQPPITVLPTMSVGCVLRLMVEHKIGCVVVTEGTRLLGIFSERDALLKINAEAAALADRPVSQFMTPQPQTVTADAKIAFAVQRMDMGGFRHLPVVDDRGSLVGIISARDILRYLSDVMTRGEA
jgi:CBS domain-containing protein